MQQQAKYTNNEFTVKELVIANLLLGIFFLVLFLFMFPNFLSDTKPYDDDKRNISYAILFLILLPAILYIIKSYFHQVIITVNKDGFYYKRTLKTNWTNFINAEVIEEERERRPYHTDVFLILQFYKPDEEGYFVTRILLSNTFSKSGEEIIEAINYFRAPKLS